MSQSQNNSPPPAVSTPALVGMLMGIFSLVTFCVFLISLPLAITAVILGHREISAAGKKRPPTSASPQAFIALITGYCGMLLSVMILVIIVTAPRWAPRDGADVGSGDESLASAASASSNEALKAAEYEIASQRGQASGRGNSPEAIQLAQQFSNKLKEISDEAFTKGRRPLIQLSQGEYLTYCELHEDRCLFLVHVPSYRKFTGDAKQSLARIAWMVAQHTVSDKLPANAKLGVGLRGVLMYGDIMVGTCSGTDEDKMSDYRSGKESELPAFFERVAKTAMLPTANETTDDSQSQPSPFGASPFETASTTTSPAEIAATENSFTENSFTEKTPAEKSLPETSPFETSPFETSPFETTPSPTDMADAAPGKEPVAGNVEAPKSALPSKPKPEFVNEIDVQLVLTIPNPSWSFTALAFNPNGKTLAAGKLDESLHILDANSGETLRTLDRLEKFGQITALAYSANGEFLIAGGGTGQTLRWKVESDKDLTDQEPQHDFDSEVERLITSPKHSFFMAANKKGSIAWQAFGANKSQPRLLQEFKDDVHALWLPISDTQAMATDGRTLVKFSLRDGQIAEKKDLRIKYPRFAAFSPSGRRLVVATNDDWHLIDLTDASGTRKAKLPRGEMIYGLQFHANERWIAVGMRGKVGLFDFEKGQIIAYAETGSIFHQNVSTFSADGKFLATCSATSQDPIKIFKVD